MLQVLHITSENEIMTKTQIKLSTDDQHSLTNGTQSPTESPNSPHIRLEPKKTHTHTHTKKKNTLIRKKLPRISPDQTCDQYSEKMKLITNTHTRTHTHISRHTNMSHG